MPFSSRDGEARHTRTLLLGAVGAGLSLAAHAAEAAPPASHGADADGDGDTDVDAVVVTGLRPLLGDKIPLTLRNTPQSVTVVTEKLMREQGATRLEDALRNVPGITLNAGEGAARGDTVNLRGFSAFNDFFLDGIRDAAVYNRDSFDLESVEVLKGPSATLFGRGSTGGAINQVSKTPGLTPSRTLTGTISDNDGYRGELDIDQPLGAAAALRLNAMGESSNVADRDHVHNARWGVAPSLAVGLGGPTTLTLSYLHQQEDNVPDVGVPFLNGAPAPVPRGADFGLVSDRTRGRDDIVTMRLRHDFGGGITLADTFRWAGYRFDYQFDAPNYGASTPAATTPLADILVGRDSPSSSGLQTNLTNQLDLTARFSTGPVTHVLAAGIELARQTNALDRYANPFNGDNAWIAQTPLLAPDPYEARPSEPVSQTQHTAADSEAAYVTDTVGLTRHIDLIGGLRLDRFAADYHQTTVATGAVLDLSHVDTVVSPRLALVVRPTDWGSVYASYGTSFDPSAEALSLTTRTANLGPVKARTYEVGGKASVLGGGLLLTGAAFRIEVDNAQTNDPDNPTVTVLNGDQRVDGFELGASGRIGPRLEVDAGYTWLDGVTIRSGTAAFVGRQMPNLARNAVNLWLEYDVSRAWEVGLGGNYLDRRFADGADTASVPSYVVWNAMVAWKVNARLSLQINAINLFDKTYYDGIYYTSPAENHVVPGAGRTVKLTARARF